MAHQRRPRLPLPGPDRLSLRQLQAAALLSAFPSDPTLATVLARMGFVQADPIRAPARAQDLILRQRVPGYRAGDLELRYPELDLEEGYLYAYGFLTRALWQLRHPPRTSGLTARERRVLAAVQERGEVHPEQLQAEFGAARARNAWGGYSTVIKLTLERLHARGLLRVSRRQQGIRLYAPNPAGEVPSRQQAFSALAQTVTTLLAPVPEASLRTTLAPLARALRCDARALLAAQRAEGRLRAGTLDGVTYLWPALSTGGEPSELPHPDQVPRLVRLLAPFDPLVWDRRRFEQLWGWAYRFEAYTPVKKRVRGYYALPLAWGNKVIGWANVARSDASAQAAALPALDVELGFVNRRPREREFGVQLEVELERLRRFLAAPGAGG